MSNERHAISRRLALQLAASAGAALISPAWAQTAASGEPIKIGAVISLTGPGAGIGQPERNGLLLAESAINKNGGVKGRPIKVLIEDDTTKAELAKSKAESLIFGEKVVALLGASLTASTDSMAAITNAENMAHVCFTGLGPPIELTYKSLFHILPPQILNARAMLEYTTKSLQKKKIGVLHDTGYGQVVMTQLNAVKAEYGVEYASVEKFEVGATDVSTQAAKVRAADPEVVFVIGTSPVPFRNARQVKIAQPIVSAIGGSSYEIIRGMGEFADDIVFPEFMVGEDPLPHQAEFVKLYQATYSALPKNFEAAAWDGLHVVAAGIEAAGGGGAARDAIAKAIRDKPYAGVMASYNFAAADLTGIELTSYNYSKLVKGKITRLPFRVTK